MTEHRTGAHRATRVRPRYGRLAVLGASGVVTAIALLGSLGALPPSATGDGGHADNSAAIADNGVEQPEEKSDTEPRTERKADADSDSRAGATGTSTRESPSRAQSDADSDDSDADALPAGSGTGRRVVFSQGEQRVWLVDDTEHVKRSYLVSGSVLDNLDPGSYSVYSRSRWAVGVDDSGVMQYFARFTRGPSGAAIGFHSIPTKQGLPLQTIAQLGTPQSHGCIRQKEADAIALWDFAPVGTAVVVTA